MKGDSLFVVLVYKRVKVSVFSTQVSFLDVCDTICFRACITIVRLVLSMFSLSKVAFLGSGVRAIKANLISRIWINISIMRPESLRCIDYLTSRIVLMLSCTWSGHSEPFFDNLSKCFCPISSFRYRTMINRIPFKPI